MALKQHENLLAIYPEILGRLKTVKGIKAVKEIGELAELLAQGAAKRKAAPLDGAVYVVFGGSTFADEAKNGKFLKSTLHFTFVLARSYTANGKSTLYEVGETLTAIQRAFRAGTRATNMPLPPSAASPRHPSNTTTALLFTLFHSPATPCRRQTKGAATWQNKTTTA